MQSSRAVDAAAPCGSSFRGQGRNEVAVLRRDILQSRYETNVRDPNRSLNRKSCFGNEFH
jgi:hypothetical protein